MSSVDATRVMPPQEVAPQRKKAEVRWTPAQIKEHTQRIQEVLEQQKRLMKKGENFTAVTPQDIARKLKRQNSPMIVWQSWGWVGPSAPGGTVGYNVGIYNPDPTDAVWLFAHVWIGSGNVDPAVGTFLSNVDTRFPRITQPEFAGLTLAGGATTSLSFALKVPATVQRTNYLGNCCLMQLNWHDVGTYLDRGVFVFTVS